MEDPVMIYGGCSNLQDLDIIRGTCYKVGFAASIVGMNVTYSLLLC